MSTVNPRKPKNICASSKGLPALSDQHTQTTSGHATPKRARESLGMAKIKSPPLKETIGPLWKGESTDVVNAEEIKSKF